MIFDAYYYLFMVTKKPFLCAKTKYCVNDCRNNTCNDRIVKNTNSDVMGKK